MFHCHILQMLVTTRGGVLNTEMSQKKGRKVYFLHLCMFQLQELNKTIFSTEE